MTNSTNEDLQCLWSPSPMDKRHWTRHFHWRHSSITKDSMDTICHLEHLSKNLPPFGNNWRRWRNNLQLFHVILPRWFIFSWFSINVRGRGGAVWEKRMSLVEAIEDIEWTGEDCRQSLVQIFWRMWNNAMKRRKLSTWKMFLVWRKSFKSSMKWNNRSEEEEEEEENSSDERDSFFGRSFPMNWYHSDKKLFKWNFFFIGLDNDHRGRGNWSIFGIGQQVEMFISQPLDKSLDKLSFRNWRLKRIAPQWGFWVNCCKRKRGGKNSSIVNIERNIRHSMMFVFFFMIISSRRTKNEFEKNWNHTMKLWKKSRGNISIRVHLSMASFGTMEINGCPCFSLLSSDRCPTNRSV